MRAAQPTALLQEHFVTREADWLTPKNLEWVPQRPLPSEKLSWPVLEPATGRRVVTLGTASVLLLPLVLATATATATVAVTVKVLTLGLAWFLAMASASMVVPVKAIALAKAMELVIAMALMRAARLSALQSAESQLVCWIVPWTQVSESDLQSIRAPT